VKTGRPGVVDEEEPRRVAAAVAEMGIRHAVITSVNRDELPDGGAHVFAACIEEIRRSTPEVTVEVLIPDYLDAALDLVLAARPAVLNHNVETVPRLYRRVRPQARYQRSLEVLRQAAARGAYTKSGLMVGLGEEEDEVMRVLEDLRSVGCRFVTIGQYLQPSKRHLPVDRYVDAEEFRRYARQARRLGFQRVQSGPLVRSSYHAADFV
jgi:lipoic acid synthetase